MIQKNIGLLVKFFLVIALCTLIVSADQTNDSDKYTFTNYGGEVYTPEPMEFGANLDGTEQISVMTTSDTLENETGRKHVLLQFYETPNDEQLGVLKEYEVRRVAVAAKYTFIFSMPADYTTADLPDDVGLRWMGEVLVENKDPRGYGLSVPEYARLDDGKIILTIRFYEDVTSENALSVVTKYTNNYTTPSSYYTYIYDIIIDENNITNVISEDAVHSYGYRNEETVSDDSFEDSEDIENNNVSSLIEDEDNTEIDSNNVNKSPGFSALISISVFGLVFCLCRKG